jgi:hypothetical protein
MPRIFVPSNGPGDWRVLLAEPEKHWARRYSARTLAHCWAVRPPRRRRKVELSIATHRSPGDSRRRPSDSRA